MASTIPLKRESRICPILSCGFGLSVVSVGFGHPFSGLQFDLTRHASLCRPPPGPNSTPQCPEIESAAGQLSSFAMIVAEHPSESLAPLDFAVEVADGGGRLQ